MLINKTFQNIATYITRTDIPNALAYLNYNTQEKRNN